MIPEWLRALMGETAAPGLASQQSVGAPAVKGRSLKPGTGRDAKGQE